MQLKPHQYKRCRDIVKAHTGHMWFEVVEFEETKTIGLSANLCDGTGPEEKS